MKIIVNDTQRLTLLIDRQRDTWKTDRPT